MKHLARFFVLLGLCTLFGGCSGLGRRINQALPEFLRSEPGKKEMALFAEVRRAREWTPEQLEAQERLFNKAEKAHDEERWEDSADVLKEYLELYTTSRFDERARFLLGEDYYFDEAWGKSFKSFKKFNELYVVSDLASLVMEYQFLMGKDYIEGKNSVFFGIFTNSSIGEEYLNYVVERYPTGKRAPDAEWLLAQFYMQDDDWVKAAPAFRFLADNYRDSEWFAPARYYHAYCLYRQVKGAVYDPQIQTQAREAFEQYLREVPEGEWGETALGFRTELAELEARHLLEVGQWYLGMGKPFGARYYLESVRVRHPGSQAAKDAAQILSDLDAARREALQEGAPEVPEQQPESPAPDKKAKKQP